MTSSSIEYGDQVLACCESLDDGNAAMSWHQAQKNACEAGAFTNGWEKLLTMDELSRQLTQDWYLLHIHFSIIFTIIILCKARDYHQLHVTNAPQYCVSRS